MDLEIVNVYMLSFLRFKDQLNSATVHQPGRRLLTLGVDVMYFACGFDSHAAV